MENVDVGYVSHLIIEGKTYQQISDALKQRFPDERGFSLRSVRRFCSNNGLSTTMSKENLERRVTSAVDEVFFYALY